VLGQDRALVVVVDEGAEVAGSVADVIVLVVFGEVKDVLDEESHLFGIGNVQLDGQIQDLKLDDVLFLAEGLDGLAQDVGGDLAEAVRVLADEPKDGRTRHRYCDLVSHLRHALDDQIVFGYINKKKLGIASN